MKKKAILTVEENKPMRYLLTTVLAEYNVTSAPSCNDALRQLNTEIEHDLIILDIPDAQSDNFKLLEHLSTSSYMKNIPTVILSNSADEAFMNDATKLGAAFFKKPFDPVILADKVRELTHDDTRQLLPKRRRFVNLNIF